MRILLELWILINGFGRGSRFAIFRSLSYGALLLIHKSEHRSFFSQPFPIPLMAPFDLVSFLASSYSTPSCAYTPWGLHLCVFLVHPWSLWHILGSLGGQMAPFKKWSFKLQVSMDIIGLNCLLCSCSQYSFPAFSLILVLTSEYEVWYVSLN